MKFNIKQFVIFIIIALLGVLYTIFADYYFEQREQTASVILNTLQDDMSEVGYILSKNVKRLENIPSHRAVLDRAAANNEFIAAIMVVNDDQTLLTTDPSYRRVPNGNKGRRQVNETAYDVLTKTQSLEGTIRFYENAKLIKLRLIFVIDRGEVDLYLRHNKIKFFIYFGVLPSVLMLLIWGLLNFFLTQPLEKLRQYLMTQNKVPKAFKLNELEEIRLSMIKTFSRLEQEQEELYRLARTDMLTGLANRNALNEYLKQLIASCAAEKKEFAFLFLDLDFFKTVNDSLGHHIGDALLQKVGQSIRELLHQGDFIARVGGDEFIILLHNYRSINELSNIVENIQKRLNNPWVIQKHHINISSSVG
ncbi:MAG: GGDEF domain-containing protein, partial [Hydrogenovibrio sp.]|nr:GGDEF domain-containing protein [Hydrogenovibrio sp.]